ncbi:MAG TPA: glycoside hydrolase family 19 protein [Shinella sp.]|jgi:predicted chitinase|uniref:glycoside hydrolase family 19 protein n=1 Tax=Shinella sp. TaxID=1870904 RepID=UPI002E0DCD7F|nr:glycoside hydrolase family 19 protein [Shinella sp.]
MVIDRKAFFDEVRGALYAGRLGQGQVAGLTALLDRFEQGGETRDRRFLAYMLATAHHETGGRLQPVRETFAATDAAAIGVLDRAFAAGRLPQVSAPYWRRDADGKSWLGRGLVQITHRRNYERLAELTGIDLVARPERAMEMATSVEILFIGMLRGAFTGRRLADHFAAGRADWVGARRIINGLDRAERVAGYGQAFFVALGG